MCLPAITASFCSLRGNSNLYKDDKKTENIKNVNIIYNKVSTKPFPVKFSLTFLNSTISIVNNHATKLDNPSRQSKIPDEKKLGMGGFSNVYQGTFQNGSSQLPVAIKNLYPDIDTKQRYQEEANALLALQNQEYIVQFICAIEVALSVGYDHYIVMELGDMTLSAYLQQLQQLTIHTMQINTLQLKHAALGFFSSLITCIEQGIYNVDITLDNFLLFFKQHTFKMIDFGILRQEDNNKIKSQMIRQAACCFALCAVDRYKDNSENTEIKKELKKIALNSSLGDSCKATDQDKNYFSYHISAYVNNDPLLITLANNIFNEDGCLLEIKKIIPEFKKSKIQPFTDIRQLL
jgi:serine/threonine protein kinase